MASSSAPNSDYRKHRAGQDEPSSSDPVDSAASRQHGFGELGSDCGVAPEREEAYLEAACPRAGQEVHQSGRGS